MNCSISHLQAATPKATKSGSYKMRSKKEMQQQYRTKETEGFDQLHRALHAVNPNTPVRRDIARHQLLIMGERYVGRSWRTHC